MALFRGSNQSSDNRSDVTRDGTRRVPPVEVRCLRALRFGLV